MFEAFLIEFRYSFRYGLPVEPSSMPMSYLSSPRIIYQPDIIHDLRSIYSSHGLLFL
jgi:hypothetical protein